MSPIATAWIRLRTDLREHQAELRLSVRVTVSAVLTLVIGQWLNVPLVLWSVLTAVIVTQIQRRPIAEGDDRLFRRHARRRHLCGRRGRAHPA